MVTRILRFRDLKERGIAKSWPQLRNMVTNAGFPPGRYLGPNTRGWTETEVQAWIDALPTENPRKAAAKVVEAA